MHAVLHAHDAEAARRFFRDALGWPHVDAHDGWLIFGTGPSELGVDPAAPDGEHHEISLLRDDIGATMEELRGRGAVFGGDVQQRVFGRTAVLEVPGGPPILLYQPRHMTATGLRPGAAAWLTRQRVCR
jgi:catechol 2,3-dioxygenase-like lactoylglutathione lyase family enzyme